MDLGGGFNKDSVFHVAIIQGVLNTGYPTTGQHLEPWVSYHALSHYVDAVALWLLGIDPWESYALLFFAKGVAITLSVIYFAMKVAEPHSSSFFWLTLLIVYPAFTATWYVIGSHGQWFPMIALALSAHRVFVVAMKDRRTWVDYALLTVLVIVLSLGKISLGFSFAVLVGLWLFFRRPIDWRLIAVGIAWVTFFGAYADIFSERMPAILDTSDLLGRFRWAAQETFAVCLVAILSGIIARVTRAKCGWSFSSALIVSVVVLVITGIFLNDSYQDVGYFFHGLFSVTLLLAVPLVASGLFRNTESAAGPNKHEIAGIKLLAFVGSMLFVFSPVASKTPVPPYASLASMSSVASVAVNHTYFWYNEGAKPADRMSVWQALRGKQVRIDMSGRTAYAANLRDSIRNFIRENDLSGESPLLHINSEQFETIGALISTPAEFPSGETWSTGLAVTAVAGLPLVFGVPDPKPRDYGFSDYDERAFVIRENEASSVDLCGFNRPVIVALDITTFELLIACPAK